MKIDFEFTPWLSERLGHGLQPLKWQVEAEEGETMASLFTRLCTDDGFRREIFDPEAQRLHEAIALQVNGLLYEINGGIQRKMEDGDKLFFIMALPGG